MIQQNNKAFAEIIESSLHTWRAQSWQWDHFPSYGSLATVSHQGTVYVGLVYEVETGSMDPSRYPFPYQKSETELQKEQPQLFAFLRTTFSCLTLGYYHKGKLFYQAPSEPVKMHSFVMPLERDLFKQFMAHETYLHRLFGLNNYIQNIDELLIALIGILSKENMLSSEKLKRFLQTYTLLTGNEYRRTKLFLQRIAPHCP